MATRPEFIEYLLGQMSGAGAIRSRAMFGGHTIYCDEKVMGIVGEDQFFLKPTDAGREYIGRVNEAPPYEGAKNFFLIDEKLDDAEWLTGLIKASWEELPKPRPKRKRKG